MLRCIQNDVFEHAVTERNTNMKPSIMKSHPKKADKDDKTLLRF